MGVFDIVMEKPAGFSMTMSSTHLFHWLQQVFPWLCQVHTPSTDCSRFFHDYVKHTPLQLTSAGFSMTMSSTHLFNWLQQVFPWLCQARTSSTDFSKVFPWLCQTHPSPRLTSAGFSMTISNTPIASPDFSRIFHEKTCWIQSKRWVCLI
jgi:hypothetical protein